MSDLSRDSFEEFLKNSLGEYTSSEQPDWSEMEARLDQAGTGSSQGSSAVKTSLVKWAAAFILAAGLAVWVANLLNDDQPQGEPGSNESTGSFMDKIRALNLEDNTVVNEDRGATENIRREEQVMTAVEKESLPADRRNTTESDQENVTSGQTGSHTQEGPPKPVHYEPSGPTYDMLRAEFKNKPTPLPVAAFTADIQQGCVPLKVVFKLESQDIAMKHLWNFGDGTFSSEANPSHVYRQTGIYNAELTVTSLINQELKTKSSSEPIVVNGLPKVAFNWDGEQQEAGSKVTFVDLSSNVIDWQWNFGDLSGSRDANPTHSYSEKGTYIVELVGKDANGCADTLTSTIRISGVQLTNKFFTPNAFTPNGDGSNDVFQPMINGVQALEFEMSIYDRHGNEVFATNDLNQPWDGRLKDSGEMAPQGTYIWLIILRDDKGNHDRQLGEVTLIK